MSPPVLALLPFVFLALTAVALLLAAAFYRSHRLSLAIALIGLTLTLGDALTLAPGTAAAVTPLILVDGHARLYIVLLVLATLAVLLLSYYYLGERRGQRQEFYILLVMAALGGAVLVAASHFASFFLGLELLSVSLYALIAYPRARSPEALEAGMKYLILAGAASAFILFGMALIYADLGTMALSSVSTALHLHGPATDRLLLAGLALMIVGLGLKLGLVPFHFWTPDVYQGAPEPVAAFMATASKGAVLALMLRHFSPLAIAGSPAVLIGVTILALASMLGGSLLALMQSDLKRILGGSSIAHMGYAAMAFVVGGRLGATALAFYLVSYFVTMLGLFGLLSMLSREGGPAGEVESYRGFARERPWLAAAMTAMLLSLAGMPLTAGFVGKFYLALTAASAALWVLLGGLVAGSVISLFYYLRVVSIMFDSGDDGVPQPAPSPLAHRPLPLAGGVLLGGLTLALVWLGVYPAPLLRAIEAAVGGVFQ